MAGDEVIYGRDVDGAHRGHLARLSTNGWFDWWRVEIGYAESHGTLATDHAFTRFGARRLARRWLRRLGCP